VTSLAAVSVPACRIPLQVMERLTYSRDELAGAVDALRARTGAEQLLLLSTCERVELYGVWAGEASPVGLIEALLEHRGVTDGVGTEVASVFAGPAAARHLLRVACGLESFVLGETDVVGQVKAAGEASRLAGGLGLELERLVAAAMTTSRRVHRRTALGRLGGSVAPTAVRTAAALLDGSLRGRRVLVVGAGQVAGGVVAHATSLQAEVTVCNRTKRHADRFRAAGARVVDLVELDTELGLADVVIFGTASPHRLLTADQLRAARDATDRALLVLDLCVPRNVDPEVAGVPGVRLVDLSDVRRGDAHSGRPLAADVADAEQVVEEEVARYLRWVADRSAVDAVRRLRADVEACAREEAARSARGLPPELQELVEQAVHRATRRLAHQPTRRLVDAVVSGDDQLAEALAGLFADAGQSRR
jgi:glutamyl-tRNA reductase